MLRHLMVLVGAGAGGLAFSLLHSLLLVRLLRADTFGQYAYLVAVLAVIPTFYESFDQTLVRFLGSLPHRRQLRLLQFVLFSKFVTLAVVLVLFLIWYGVARDRQLDAITQQNAFALFFYTSLLALPLKLVGNVLRSVLNALETYRHVATLSLLGTVIPLCFSASLSVAGASAPTALRWLAAEALVTPAIALVASLRMLDADWLRRMMATKTRSYMKALWFAYHHYFRPYGQPLATGVFFQYVKQYLPLILLGQLSTFSNVAYYRVLSAIADVGTRFVPSIASYMIPTAVRSRSRDPRRFTRRFLSHGALYLIGMGVILLAFTAGHPIVFWAFGLETSDEVSIATVIVSLTILLASLGFLLNYLFLVGGDTSANYFVSPADNLFFALCIVLLAPYQLIGMVTAGLLRRIAGNAMLTYVSVRRHRYLSGRQYSVLLTVTIILSTLLLAIHLLQ